MKENENTPDLLPEDVPVLSANERWKAGIKSKNPDREFASDDDYYEASMSGYDAEHEKVKAIVQSNAELAKRMEQDPKAAAAVAEFLGGAPLPVALKKYFTDEELVMLEGEDGYDKYLEAIKAREAQREASARTEEERQANLAASGADIDKFAEDRGLSEDEMIGFLKRIEDEIIKPVSLFKLDYTFLEKAEKFLNFDSMMAETADLNYKKGKNEKIVETRRAVKEASQLPELNGGASGGAAKTGSKSMEAFDAIIERSQEDDIFKRGGFTRKK